MLISKTLDMNQGSDLGLPGGNVFLATRKVYQGTVNNIERKGFVLHYLNEAQSQSQSAGGS